MSKFVSKIFTRYNIIESQTFIFQSNGSFQFFAIYIYIYIQFPPYFFPLIHIQCVYIYLQANSQEIVFRKKKKEHVSMCVCRCRVEQLMSYYLQNMQGCKRRLLLLFKREVLVPFLRWKVELNKLLPPFPKYKILDCLVKIKVEKIFPLSDLISQF